MPNPLKPIGTNGFRRGYRADSRNGSLSQLSYPSVNVRLNRGFSAITRNGYADTSWDLNQANKTAFPYYVKRFNVSLFAVGTKILYIDHNDSNAVRDTGLTMTDGTTTRFEEVAGQVLATNTTDGQRLIVFLKLNDAAATLGDGTVTVDIDGSTRVARFDTALSTTGALRIRGTSEPYASVVDSTGVFTLSGTLTQSYPNDTIATVVYDVSTSRPKATKLVYWKESVNAIGVSEQGASSTSDVPPAAMHFTDFVTAATIEKILAWTGGSSGVELVGKWGNLVNAVAMNNNLYLFKEDSTSRIAVTDVNTSSGARPPQPFCDEGCANADSAVAMGTSVVFVTKTGRVRRIKYADQYGNSTDQLDSAFDDDIYADNPHGLKRLSEDFARDCILYYDGAENLLYFQARYTGGEWITQVYEDRPLYDEEGRVISEGRWLPPDKNKSFRMYFNVGRDLYATDIADDTIYKVNDGNQDEGSDIECCVSPGELNVPGGKWKEIEVTGGARQPTEVEFTPYINGVAGVPKTIAATFPGRGSGVGNDQVGDAVGGVTQQEEYADFAERLMIYPSLGNRFQPRFTSLGNGHAFRIDSLTLHGSAYSKLSVTAK